MKNHLLHPTRGNVFLLASFTILTLSATGGQITPLIGAGDNKNVIHDTFKMRNKTGQNANDLHVEVSVRDPSAFIEGAIGKVKEGNIVGALEAGGPPGPKKLMLDITDISVDNLESFSLEWWLDLNHLNQRWVSWKWTKDGQNIAAPRKGGGHDIGGPKPGGNGGGGVGPGGGKGGQAGGGGSGFYVHPFVIYNDEDKPAILQDFYVYASMDYYPNLGDIPWSLVDPLAIGTSGSVTIDAGSSFTFNYETIGAYSGGHLYYKYSLIDDDTEVVGDHPIPTPDSTPGVVALLVPALLGLTAVSRQCSRRSRPSGRRAPANSG